MPRPTYEELKLRVQEQDAVIARLRVAEGRYRSLFAAIDAGVCLLERLPPRPDGRRDYRYLAMNPAMQAMFGVPDLSGQSIRDNFPDAVADWYDDFDRVLETGRPARVQRRSDAQRMVLEMFVARVDDDSGRQLLAVVRDVSARVLAEQRIAESERSFRGFFDNALVGAAQLDLAGRFRRVNQRFCEMSGYSAEELEGQRGPFDLTHPDDARPDRDRIARLLAGEPYDAEKRSVRKDGAVIWIHVTASPVRDESGRVLFLASVVEDITERKLAEQRLALSEQRLRLATEGARMGIWSWDLATNRVDWSEQCRRHFALPPGAEPSIGHLDAVLHPDDRQRVARLIDDAIQGRPTLAAEYRIVHPDGSVRWISATGMHYANPDGGPGGIAGVTVDTTERREAEDALKRRGEQLQLAAEGAGIGLWYWSLPGDALDWSDLHREMFALPPGAAPSWEHFRAVLHPDDRERVEREGRASLERRADFRVEYRIVRPDGEVRWISALGRPYADADGSLRGVGGIVMDVTAQKAAGAELERMRLLMAEGERLAGLGVWEYDVATQAVFWSAEQCRIFGVDPAPKCPDYARIMRERIHPDDAAEVDRVFRAAVAQRAPYEHEHRIVRPDGSVRQTRNAGEPYLDAAGNLVRYVGTTIDVTDARAAEAELQEARTAIDAQARNVSRLNVELARRAEAAEIANRAKTAFLAVMSHELRTPLNGVTGMIALAQRRVDDPKVAGYLARAHAASEQLVGILGDILETARIEADEVSFVAEGFTLGEVFARLRGLHGPAATDKGLVIDFELAADLASRRVVGDPLRLGQVLGNLVGNAIKFTPAGAVAVRAAVVEDGASGLLLRFDVQDTGIGLSAEEQKRLFRSFQQVDMSLTRSYGGSGLGLYIAKRLVERMGGEIGVESAPGAGSTFWFTVRLRPGEAAPEPPAAAAFPSPEAELRRRHAGARVLVVEDEEVNREYACDLLAGEGLHVEAAENGEQAVTMARDGAYDAILMDVKMPVMDGLEATRRIRALPGRERVPVIGLTALAYRDDRERCLRAGMDDCLVKPVDPETLCGMLLDWLGPGRA